MKKMNEMTIMELVEAAEMITSINEEGYVTNQDLRDRLTECGIVAGKKINRTDLIEKLKDAAYKEMIAENQDDAEPDYSDSCEEENVFANQGKILEKIVLMATNNSVRNQISRHMALSAILEVFHGKRLVEFVDRQRVENYSKDSDEYKAAVNYLSTLIDAKFLNPFVDIQGNISMKSLRINCGTMVNYTRRPELVYYRDIPVRQRNAEGKERTINQRELLVIDTRKKEFTVKGKTFSLTKEGNAELVDKLYRIR